MGKHKFQETTIIMKNPGFPGFLVFESKVVGQPRPESHPGKIGDQSGSDHVRGQKYDVTDNFSATRCDQTVFFLVSPTHRKFFFSNVGALFTGNVKNHGKP